MRKQTAAATAAIPEDQQRAISAMAQDGKILPDELVDLRKLGSAGDATAFWGRAHELRGRPAIEGTDFYEQTAAQLEKLVRDRQSESGSRFVNTVESLLESDEDMAALWAVAKSRRHGK